MTFALWASLAHADPAVLRAPGEGAGVALSGTVASAGAWLADGPWGVAVDADVAGGSLGAWFAARHRLGPAAGLGLDVKAAAGPILTPDRELAVGLVPAVAASARGHRVWASAGLAAPLAARLTGGADVVAPVLLETWAGVRLGAFTVGAGLYGGPVFGATEPWAIDLGWRGSVTWRGGQAEKLESPLPRRQRAFPRWWS